MRNKGIKRILNAQQEFKHQNKERLCFCCNELQEDKNNIKTFKISDRGFGSIYDGDELEIQVCSECAKKLKQEWFDEIPEIEDGVEVYKLENKIREFIDTNITVLENLEYIYNCNNVLMIPQKIDREDWIEDQLAVASL